MPNRCKITNNAPSRFSVLSSLRRPMTSSALTSSSSPPRALPSPSPTASPRSTTRRSSARGARRLSLERLGDYQGLECFAGVLYGSTVMVGSQHLLFRKGSNERRINFSMVFLPSRTAPLGLNQAEAGPHFSDLEFLWDRSNGFKKKCQIPSYATGLLRCVGCF